MSERFYKLNCGSNGSGTFKWILLMPQRNVFVLMVAAHSLGTLL